MASSSSSSLSLTTIAKDTRRRPNFSPEEIKALTTGVHQYSSALFSKDHGALSNKKRQIAWKKVMELVNKSGSNNRTMNELQKKYSTLTSEAKKRLNAQKREFGLTGGGTSKSLLSDTDKSVLESMPLESVSGVCGGIDTMDEDEDEILLNMDFDEIHAAGNLTKEIFDLPEGNADTPKCLENLLKGKSMDQSNGIRNILIVIKTMNLLIH